MKEKHIHDLIGNLFRRESGKMSAVLTRLLGIDNMDAAQDIVQDTLLKAMTVWKFHGIPDNPPAWLYTVARNKAIDLLRKEKRFRNEKAHIAELLQSEWTFAPAMQTLFLDHEIEDSQLRMIFACCHPSIPFESQIALTLKTLCGLSIQEIARAFLTSEETITKRLYRAREKIRQEKIEMEVPSPQELPARIEAVLKSLYLLFNEGYNSGHPDTLIRQDLCEEAMRLTILLTQNSMTDTPSSNALLALLCFQASRFDSRLDDNGHVLLLKHQDRLRWNRPLIQRGQHYLNRSADGDNISEYHIEAAIAACHAFSEDFEKTDWKQMLAWYEMLAPLKPGPIVEMNKAIVMGYLYSPQHGIDALQQITGLENNHWYHTALGDFQTDAGKYDQAKASYAKALELTSSNTEKQLIRKKLERTDS